MPWRSLPNFMNKSRSKMSSFFEASSCYTSCIALFPLSLLLRKGCKSIAGTVTALAGLKGRAVVDILRPRFTPLEKLLSEGSTFTSGGALTNWSGRGVNCQFSAPSVLKTNGAAERFSPVECFWVENPPCP